MGKEIYHFIIHFLILNVLTMIKDIVERFLTVRLKRAENPKAPSPGHRPGLGASALYLFLRPVTVSSRRIEEFQPCRSFVFSLSLQHLCSG